MSRTVTLHGSGQVVSTWSNADFQSWLLNQLQVYQGIGVVDLQIDRSWLNTLATFDITILAGNESQTQLVNLISNAFRNIVNGQWQASDGGFYPTSDYFWNTGTFVITSDTGQSNNVTVNNTNNSTTNTHGMTTSGNNNNNPNGQYPIIVDGGLLGDVTISAADYGGLGGKPTDDRDFLTRIGEYFKINKETLGVTAQVGGAIVVVGVLLLFANKK